jgi:hypothetical protein
MAVDVKKVANRRKVRYQTLDDFVQDAERLSQASVRTLGNRSYDQILGHLAFAMNGSIDGSVLRIAWPVRMVARLLRKRILTGGLSPGFRLSRANDARAWSEESPEIRPALEKAGRQSIAGRRKALPPSGAGPVVERRMEHVSPAPRGTAHEFRGALLISSGTGSTTQRIHYVR